MRSQMLALFLLLVVFLSGCAVSQGQGPGSFQVENEEIEKTYRPSAYHRPRFGIPYPMGIGGLGAVGIGGGSVGGVCP
jgi:hypothetical protein